ncbi:uncharacterized protein LOC135213448 [Macrobrachium nipponense]|uniref:uncharacterized protein LOC135213448 n=1 Tax=Macrobrachium nipponense TaxID=159736 RepID=UPI0030C8535E
MNHFLIDLNRSCQCTTQIQDGGNITTATLTVAVTGADDGTTVTCTGVNPALSKEEEPLSDRRKLTVFCECKRRAHRGAHPRETSGGRQHQGGGRRLLRVPRQIEPQGLTASSGTIMVRKSGRG